MSNCFSWVGYKAFGVFDAVPHNACILCCHELAFEPAKIVLTINSCYQYQYQYPPSRSIAQPYREPWRVWEQASGADFESRKFSGSDFPSLQVVSRPFNKVRSINKLGWEHDYWPYRVPYQKKNKLQPIKGIFFKKISTSNSPLFAEQVYFFI